MPKPYNAALLFALGAMGCVQANAADERQPGWYVNPNVGYYWFDSDRSIDDSALLGLGVGYDFKSPWALELNYLRAASEYDTQNGNDVDLDQWRVDALYHFNASGKWQPFAAVGAGHNRFDTRGGNYDESLLHLGAGWKYQFSERTALRSDLRFIDSLDEEDWDVAFSLGLQIRLGGVNPAPAPKTSTAPQPMERDADGDGVIDRRDRCPNTPAGVQVDAAGCPLDSDGDGVPNHRDDCPDSEAGARVDEQGCYILLEETREIELRINFATDSAQVPDSYLPQIREIADFMQEYPLTDVVVEGHTDDRGAASYNQQLSARRAESVASILVDRMGIAASRVSAVGKGESEPVASNDTADGRAANRRVVGVISATVERRAQ